MRFFLIGCMGLLTLSTIFLIHSCKTDPYLPDGVIPNTNTGGGTLIDEDTCATGVISFKHQVLPILVSNCAFSGCHDANTAEDDVIMDSYNNIIKEVKPGDPNDSELYESIVDTDPDEVMPPPPYPKLASEEIQLIKTWIEQGAENTTCGGGCDSTLYTFAAVILPMMQTYCVGCHNDNLSSGDVNLKDYNHIKPYALDGSLVGTMKALTGYNIMPPSGGPLSDCRIGQIESWINEGALNN